MLEKIVLNNFTTFINETEIDFSATNYKFLEKDNVGNNRILKGALFVGENASGKTQILKSITHLLELLFSNNDINYLYNKSFYTNKDNYSIKYYFNVNGNKIIYEIELSINRIITEKLKYNGNTIINRIGNSCEFNYNEKKIIDNLPDKLLFLRRIYFDTRFYDDEILNKWFNFLKNSVYINCYTRQIFNFNNPNLLLNEYLDNVGTDEINKFLKKIDYKQTITYESKTNNELFNVISNDNSKFVSFVKDDTKIYIPEIFESTGNKTLLNLIPVLMHAVKNDCMVILDEFSSGFHNELEECLIKYFFHYSNNSQMFFTSHSTNILNNTIIRPDQIYSVTFKGMEGTTLKRFSDEMPREAQNTEKMYLNGVFDGMPRYNKIFKD